MGGAEIGLVEGADEYESFIKPLSEYWNLNFLRGLEIVADELPIWAQHLNKLYLMFVLLALLAVHHLLASLQVSDHLNVIAFHIKEFFRKLIILIRFRDFFQEWSYIWTIPWPLFHNLLFFVMINLKNSVNNIFIEAAEIDFTFWLACQTLQIIFQIKFYQSFVDGFTELVLGPLVCLIESLMKR